MLLKHIESRFAYNETIRGHLGHLDQKRLVFIGQREEEKGTWYIGFRNCDGEDTKLRLSHEAMALLVQLYNKKQKGDDVFPLEITTEWQVVKPKG